LIGYLKAGSVASLAGGSGVGILYLVSASRISSNKPFGVEAAITTSLLLAYISIPKLLNGVKPVPALLSTIALSNLINYGIVYYNLIQAAKTRTA
jgi:uncharacterized membrane protein (UPF0136 family)